MEYAGDEMSVQTIRNCTPDQNWARFVSNLSTLLEQAFKQIVWKTQKWHYNFSRSNSTWVIDQNSILHVYINNLRTLCLLHLMPFLSFSICFKIIIFFQKCYDNFEMVHKQVQFQLGVHFFQSLNQLSVVLTDVAVKTLTNNIQTFKLLFHIKLFYFIVFHIFLQNIYIFFVYKFIPFINLQK